MVPMLSDQTQALLHLRLSPENLLVIASSLTTCVFEGCPRQDNGAGFDSDKSKFNDLDAESEDEDEGNKVNVNYGLASDVCSDCLSKHCAPGWQTGAPHDHSAGTTDRKCHRRPGGSVQKYWISMQPEKKFVM
jgi:hypothetical protein